MSYQIVTLKAAQKIDIENTGNRLARIIVKKGAAKAKLSESMGCIVPEISLALVQSVIADEIGKQWMKNAIAGVQDKIIRNAAENGKLALFDDRIGLGAILDAMKVENESVRFSKESIATWFADVMRQYLVEAIRAKYEGIADSKLESMLKNYLESFQIIAGRNPTMPAATKAGLIRALEFLPQDTDDATTMEIVSRLPAIPEPQVLAEML